MLGACPDCGGDMSPRAEKCPHCGYERSGLIDIPYSRYSPEELKEDDRFPGWLPIIGGVVLVAVIYLVIDAISKRVALPF